MEGTPPIVPRERIGLKNLQQLTGAIKISFHVSLQEFKVKVYERF